MPGLAVRTDRSYLGTLKICRMKDANMKFTPIDQNTWERRSHYEYYTNLLKCGYSVTVSLDITKLHRQVKEKGLKFYHAEIANAM